MIDIDYERAALLMGIVEKQVTVLPKATALAGAALRELNEINEQAVENQREVAEEEKAKQAEIDAERQHKENVAAKERGEGVEPVADDKPPYDDDTPPLANRRL